MICAVFEANRLFRLLLWRYVNEEYLFWSHVLSIVEITRVSACLLFVNYLYATAQLSCKVLLDAVYSAARLEFEKDSFFAFLSVLPSQRFMDPTPLAEDPGTS